jgi:hypothetical protein
VERLRNEDSVMDARIFYMQEVPIEFKTYFKVELVGSGMAGSGMAGSEPVDSLPDDLSAPVAASPAFGDVPSDEPEPGLEGPSAESASGAAGSRFGLFSRS